MATNRQRKGPCPTSKFPPPTRSATTPTASAPTLLHRHALDPDDATNCLIVMARLAVHAPASTRQPEPRAIQPVGQHRPEMPFGEAQLDGTNLSAEDANAAREISPPRPDLGGHDTGPRRWSTPPPRRQQRPSGRSERQPRWVASNSSGPAGADCGQTSEALVATSNEGCISRLLTADPVAVTIEGGTEPWVVCGDGSGVGGVHLRAICVPGDTTRSRRNLRVWWRPSNWRGRRRSGGGCIVGRAIGEPGADHVVLGGIHAELPANLHLDPAGQVLAAICAVGRHP